MSTFNPSEIRNMMEAYNAVHDPELRHEIEEEKEELELLALEIIENAAYVLFSQGYNVQQLCEYFEGASTDVIVEDFISFAEGQSYLSESFIVSDAYIQEQFEILNEGLLDFAARQGGRLLQAGKNIAGKAVNAVKTAATGGPIKKVKVTDLGSPKGGPLVKTGSSAITPYNPTVARAGQSAAAGAGGAAKGFFGKAAETAKNVMGRVGKFASKIPGAGVVSKALPGIGAGLYGADAASRFSKGDWGGGLLSTAGAVTSLIPGAGAVASLAPAGIQMATDAMGLTGDKSKGQAGAPKQKPMDPKQKYNASKALGGQAAFQAGGGASAMKKDPNLTAADVQKRGTAAMRGLSGGDLKKGAQIFKAKQEIMSGKNRTKPAAPASPGSGPAAQKPGSGKGKPTAQQQAQQASQQQRSSGQSSTPRQQWAKANPALAAAEDEKRRIRGTAQTDNPLIDQGMRSRMPAGAPTVQSPEVSKLGSGNQSLANNPYAGRSATSTNKATGSKKPGSLVSSFDMFDVVIGHLLDEGYADSEETALKIMANMSTEWRNSIIDESQRARENPEDHDKEEKRKYEPVRGERTPMPPRGNKKREDFEKWYAKHVR